MLSLVALLLLKNLKMVVFEIMIPLVTSVNYSSYVYAGKDDPLVTDKTHGAFLAVDKVSGEMCLDVYDFTKDLSTKQAEMLAAKEYGCR